MAGDDGRGWPLNASCVLVFRTMREPPTKYPPRGGSRVPVVARFALLKALNHQMSYALLQALICGCPRIVLCIRIPSTSGCDGGSADHGGPTAG